MTHELKCHPEPFRAVKDGSKPFEWRKYDRDFRAGDYIWLREWKPEYNLKERRTGFYSGDGLTRKITYIIREGFGIPEGYCIMGLSQPIADERDELRNALENCLWVLDGTVAAGRNTIADDEVLRNGKAILAKYHKP